MRIKFLQSLIPKLTNMETPLITAWGPRERIKLRVRPLEVFGAAQGISPLWNPGVHFAGP